MHNLASITRSASSSPLAQLLILAILIVPVVGTSRGRSQPQPEAVLRDGVVTFHRYDRFGITIAATAGTIEFSYEPKNIRSVEDVARGRGFISLINGSYFHPNRMHAGLLRINGQPFTALGKDRQLTHVVRYAAATKKLVIIDAAKWVATKDATTLEFQTGPLVIRKGRVAKSIIRSSLNGRGKHMRTLLAADQTRTYFITVRQWVSLLDVGEFLASLPLFDRATLDVINLDGGSSVAFFSAKFPELNFNETAVLPILLGVK